MATKKKTKRAKPKRKLATKFWKKSDTAIDVGIDSSIDLGKKTKKTGKEVMAYLKGESKQLAKKTKTTHKKLQKQSKKLKTSIPINAKNTKSKKKPRSSKKAVKIKRAR